MLGKSENHSKGLLSLNVLIWAEGTLKYLLILEEKTLINGFAHHFSSITETGLKMQKVCMKR